MQPIQYWVDSGAPEDVKKALIEGASWWNQAFEAAGFRNAFKVDVLPEGADPMDIRYNMINWVHRSTRGWSSGGTVTDPRTGEIIKATVTLGSLRDRQDYMIFEGLLSPYVNGDEKPAILYETALARIRQLSAHEVGHTLGLGHNYYSSGKGWISVMDYPHPLEKLKADGTIDLSEAYAPRIGDWDKVTINYGYREFPKGTNEAAALTKILADAWEQDLRYFTNQDTDIHPRSDQWSNGTNQADELNRHDEDPSRRARSHRRAHDQHRRADDDDRRAARAHLHASPLRGRERGIDDRRPGLRVRDARRRADPHQMGDGGQSAPGARSAGRHVEAFRAHDSPERPRLIPPRPPGYGLHRELFPRTTGEAFDPLGPATVAADVTIGFVLQHDRAARMVAQNAVDPTLPGLGEVIDRLTKATFDAVTSSPYEAEVRRAAERVLVDRVIWLATAAPNGQARAIASMKLQRLADGFEWQQRQARARRRAAHAARGRTSSASSSVRRKSRSYCRPAKAPPGAPIGDLGQSWLAAPAWCVWDDEQPSTWLFYQPPF